MEIIVEAQDVGVPEEKTDYIVRQPLDCVSKTKPKKFKVGVFIAYGQNFYLSKLHKYELN